MLKMIQKRLPIPVRNAWRRRDEVRALSHEPRVPCDATNLTTDIPTLNTEGWDVAIQAGLIEQKAGAVNPGDRRAIYALTRSRKPKAVLEIGTNVGGSTVMFALALKKDGGKLVTVDIEDVNGPAGPCARAKVARPIEAIRKIDCESVVNFVTQDSLEFLRDCREKFDLIFLDGRHDAYQVYREIPLALKLLNPNGLILLHDVFPNLQPLWSNRKVIPGPWLAVERFQREGADIKAVPLGALPWPTKLGSNITSLAYLVRHA